MIDSILSAPYPDATPLRVKDAHDLLSQKGDFEHLLADGSTEYYYKYSADPDAPKLQDAFVRRPHHQKILWKRSLWPIAGFVGVAAMLLVSTGLNLYFNWSILGPDEFMWGNIVMTGLLVGAAWAFFYRWMKLAVTLVLSFDMDDEGKMLDRYATGAMHVRSSTIKSYTSGQLDAFHESDAYKNHFGIGFEARFVVSGRGNALLLQEWRRRRRLLDEAAQLVTNGIVADRSPSAAKAYDSRDITAVELVRIGWLQNAISLPLGIIVTLAFASGLWAAGAWLIDILGHRMVWPYIVGVVAAIAALLLIGTIVLMILFTGYAWLAGTPVTETVSGPHLDHRVRVRFSNGRWMTVLRTPRQVVAVELYNLILRDIRRPID